MQAQRYRITCWLEQKLNIQNNVRYNIKLRIQKRTTLAFKESKPHTFLCIKIVGLPKETKNIWGFSNNHQSWIHGIPKKQFSRKVSSDTVRGPKINPAAVFKNVQAAAQNIWDNFNVSFWSHFFWFNIHACHCMT